MKTGNAVLRIERRMDNYLLLIFAIFWLSFEGYWFASYMEAIYPLRVCLPMTIFSGFAALIFLFASEQRMKE